MKHSESSIQITCINEFRARYPWAAKLLIHVKNEETGGRVAGAIHKAEGVVAGASDLLLLIPSVFDNKYCAYLSIEMKAPGGRVRDNQLLFGTYVQAAGAAYRICYGVDEFVDLVASYMDAVPSRLKESLMIAYKEDERCRIQKEREKLKSAMEKKRTTYRLSANQARQELKRILA